ncbi:MAG: SpoIIE family protein phosphatase [Bacteroidetes bacterium]|nr:SpoIIE family protein phosphatase [Bacteroidota bacterium]
MKEIIYIILIFYSAFYKADTLTVNKNLLEKKDSLLFNYYYSKYTVFKKIKQFDSALIYRKCADSIEEVMLDQAIEKQTNIIETKYQSIKKDTEIKELQHENQLSTLENKRHKLFILFIVITSFLTALTLIFYIKRYREKKKSNNALLEKQNVIEHANNELSTYINLMKESIDYAAHIQQSILPGEQMLKNYFPNSFILNKPLEVVGGDFFWVHNSDSKKVTYIALADCTGHGVAGAFMTLLGDFIFNRIIERNVELKPSQFLQEVNATLFKGINSQYLQQIKSGMNVVLLKIDTEKKIIQYSGAKNYFFHAQSQNKIIEMPSTAYTLGYLENFEFTDYELKYEKNDFIYLCTDGYMDQKGGANKSKLMKSGFISILNKIKEQKIENQKQQLENEFNNYKETQKQIDDVFVIGIEL